jgi:hypothetical protein
VTHNTVELFVGEPVGVFRGERDPAVSANVPHICTVTSFGVPRLRPPAFGAPFRWAILFLSKVE